MCTIYWTKGEKQKTRQMCLPGRKYSILPTQVTNKKILVIWKKTEIKQKVAFKFKY